MAIQFHIKLLKLTRVITSQQEFNYNNLIHMKSQLLVSDDNPKETVKHYRKSRWLRSHEKWMRDIKPREAQMPNFVPANVKLKVSELQFVSSDVLKHITFTRPEELDRAHLLECMKTAVKYQQESVGVVRGMLQHSIRSTNDEPHHESEHHSHNLQLFDVEQIGQVSIDEQHQYKSETPDEFSLKSPKDAVPRSFNPDNQIVHEYRPSDMAFEFF